MLFKAKYPGFLNWIYPEAISRIGSPKTLFLTFDDGPVPEITPWVLDILKEYKVKATFFCIGDNIRKNPALFRRIITEGHDIGNHTFHHLDGWKTKTSDYLLNIEKTSEEILKNSSSFHTKLFRPPYGKILPKQANLLLKKGYKLVMWDVISGDYDQSFSEERVYENVMKNIENGSVIVFHDSKKAEKNVKAVLPKVIKTCQKSGYTFGKITDFLSANQ